MTPATLRKHLNRLGLSQADFARLINVNVKTVKRWASLTDPFEIPRTVEILLPLLSPTRVKALLAARDKL
jgi:transcriptional regulator with XRE-family HTH domain